MWNNTVVSLHAAMEIMSLSDAYISKRSIRTAWQHNTTSRIACKGLKLVSTEACPVSFFFFFPNFYTCHFLMWRPSLILLDLLFRNKNLIVGKKGENGTWTCPYPLVHLQHFNIHCRKKTSSENCVCINFVTPLCHFQPTMDYSHVGKMIGFAYTQVFSQTWSFI